MKTIAIKVYGYVKVYGVEEGMWAHETYYFGSERSRDLAMQDDFDTCDETSAGFTPFEFDEEIEV